MLTTSLILLLLAIIAGILGFTKVARTSTTAARVLFTFAIVLAIAAVITYWFQV